MENEKKHGLTGTTGYQVGVQRKMDISLERAWNYLISKKGLEYWLGTSKLDKWETGIEFSSTQGIRGSVRVFKIYSHIRLSWKKETWKNESVLQVRTIPADDKTIISFHQDQLLNEAQRDEMKAHWSQVLSEIERILTPNNGLK